jgi:hypothetical protein
LQGSCLHPGGQYSSPAQRQVVLERIDLEAENVLIHVREGKMKTVSSSNPLSPWPDYAYMKTRAEGFFTLPSTSGSSRIVVSCAWLIELLYC